MRALPVRDRRGRRDGHGRGSGQLTAG